MATVSVTNDFILDRNFSCGFSTTQEVTTNSTINQPTHPLEKFEVMEERKLFVIIPELFGRKTDTFC